MRHLARWQTVRFFAARHGWSVKAARCSRLSAVQGGLASWMCHGERNAPKKRKRQIYKPVYKLKHPFACEPKAHTGLKPV